MKISIDLTYVRPSTQRAAKALLKELVDEIAESLDQVISDDTLIRAPDLTGHLELIEVLRPIAKYEP